MRSKAPFGVPDVDGGGIGDAPTVLDGIVRVRAVASSPRHRFSKPTQQAIVLLAGIGIEGDTHAGLYVRHRYLARRNPRAPNMRQVHLMPAELFEDLRSAGYEIQPGELGENIVTAGLDLERLPLGTTITLGDTALVELTGLRTPCVLIDRFRSGLKRRLVGADPSGPKYRCGVMAIVKAGGEVVQGALARAMLPPRPWRSLPPL